MISKIINKIKIWFCVNIILSIIFINPLYIYAEDKPASDRIIVSMGDSYSSGEGIDDFYDSNLSAAEKILSDDWLAHRSQNSWSGQLKLPGVNGVMADEENKDKHWYFVAASGAVTDDINGEQLKIFNKDKGNLAYARYLPAQISVFDQLNKENKKADYVTLTIGGNDVGFVGIIEKAAIPGVGSLGGSSYLNKNAFADLVDMLLQHITNDDITEKLKETYKCIHNKSGAKIIVAGYPKLLEQNGKGLWFNQFESEAINNAVHVFNLKIHKAVLECSLDENDDEIYNFVSVEEGFEGHEAYADEPYINKVELGAKEQDIDDTSFVSAYSMHPNEKGAEIYRDCVQAKIDELERTTSDERDIVLVLDTSGSMSGKPLDETKKAASKFIDTVLQQDASIGIVTYDNEANKVSDFSMNSQTLHAAANDINAGGSTNMEDGLKKAEEMLATSHAKKKIIVLMSDGEPNNGKVGDELISYADSIKSDGTYIYTLGFFEGIGNSKSGAQILMEKIASEGCHYEVADADDLVFFFGDIADQINGQKYIYIRIACPVDVNVTYNGETLSSNESSETARTSFGTLTFEENENKSQNSTDDRVKILRLKNGVDYNVQIAGNGTGSMNYSIGFMDENGKYSDVREFNNINISENTKIDTVAQESPSTTLKVDSDGDGNYDLKYKAKTNGIGKIVDYTYILYIIAAAAFIIALLVMYIRIKRWKKKRTEKQRQKLAMRKKFCVHCGNEMPGDKTFCSKCGKRLE